MTVSGEMHGAPSVKCAWLCLEVCMGPRNARRILGVCTRVECEFWDARCCVCARRVIECASWSKGSGLVYEGAPGCPACQPNSDCYACACATAAMPARHPPDPRFAPLTVRPRKPRCPFGTWCCAVVAAGPRCCCTAPSTRSGASCR